MKYQHTIDNVTIASDDLVAYTKVVTLLEPGYTKAQGIDATLSASLDNGTTVAQKLARDLMGDDPERRAEALQVLKAIHEQ